MSTKYKEKGKLHKLNLVLIIYIYIYRVKKKYLIK